MRTTSTRSIPYALLKTVGEGFPDILRTDRQVVIELPPDEMEVFVKVRNAIGNVIAANGTNATIPLSPHFMIPDIVIQLYRDNGVQIVRGTYQVGSGGSGGLNPSTGERRGGDGGVGSVDCHHITWGQTGTSKSTAVRKEVADLLRDGPKVDLPSSDGIYYLTYEGMGSRGSALFQFKAIDKTWWSSGSIREQGKERIIGIDNIITDISQATEDQKRYF